MFDAFGMSLEQFNAYAEECKSYGYTIEANSFDGFYSADNEEGYNVYLHYNEDDYKMSGTVKALDKTEDPKDNDASKKNTNTNEELVNGMRPSFKEAMDSYEAFYDKYCEIMKKYMENPTDMKILADYTDIVAKEAEMVEKFEAWESGDMNDTEAKYYIDVNARIAKKILEINK